MKYRISIITKTAGFLMALSFMYGCCVFKAPPELQPTAGFACAAFGGADAVSSDELPGWQIGNYFIFDLESCAQLSTELEVAGGVHLSGKGNKESFEETGGDGFEPYNFTRRTRTTYLDLPVVAKMPIYKGLSVYGGPQTSILLGAKNTTESNGESNTSKGTEGFNKVDFGLSLGLSYELSNGLSFGLGYDHGLSNVYKSDHGSSNIKNRFLKGTIGFNLNKFKNR